MKSLKAIYALFILVTAVVVSIQTQAQPQVTETPILELLNNMADKPEDHKAIADYYRKMAAQAKEEAGLHEKMKVKYNHDHGKMKGMAASGNTKKHCERIIKLQQSVAEEYEALAKLHEKSAKQ
jgi:hypothetical protein